MPHRVGRKLIAAVDDSPASRTAAVWLLNTVARQGDNVDLVAATTPPVYTATPAVPVATAGSVAALTLSWEQQRKAEEERVKQLLAEVAHELAESRSEELDLHKHVLPAAGGASGVAESIVTYAKEQHADLVVLGSRGMGAVKSTLMSLVGLGSVSDYCVHHLHCPVAVVRGRKEDCEQKAVRKVLVSLDDSPESRKALDWALANVLGPRDELHLVAVASPIPYPVSLEEAATSPPLPLDEWEATYRGSMEHTQALAKAAVADLAATAQVDEFEAASQDAIGWAKEIVNTAVEAAASKVDKERIFYKALAPEGGASDVGESIVHYAKHNGVDVVVLGARGMGAFRRAMLTFVGLGSVSDYVVHHLECPSIVVKQ